MIAPATTFGRQGRFRTDFVLLDLLRGEASAEMGAAFDGVPVKKISSAGVPGCSRYGVSRAVHGSDSNPLYRIALLFVVLRRLGMGRERALRMLAWLRAVVDEVWPEEQIEPLEDVLVREQELDAADDAEQMRAMTGDMAALRRFVDRKLAEHAYTPTVISAARQRLAAG